MGKGADWREALENAREHDHEAQKRHGPRKKHNAKAPGLHSPTDKRA